MKRILFAFIVLHISTILFSQAGKNIYQVLDIPVDARSIGLGGVNVSLLDGDINLAMNNPALLSSKSHNMIVLNYAHYLVDINFGSVGYARKFGYNNFGIAINYLDFGKFKAYNEFDIYMGNFTAKDIVLNALWSHKMNEYFNVGATAKLIYSAYERYSSAGMAFDFGANYHNEEVLLDLGLTVKNLGFQFWGYQSIDGHQNYEVIPVNILFGISKKLEKAPVRFSLTLHNLQQFNLHYERTSSADRQYKKSYEIKWYDMMFRHTVLGIELLPSKNLYLSVAFNYRRRAEMTIPAFRSLAGFSFGAGINVKAFKASFAINQFQTGNLTYHFSVASNMESFGIK